ncbi:MAG: endonuclease III [Herpetosiphonaceae bacterium]|nr:endonuclease III [Herpetosiphonaceae bacterium]
MSAEDLPAKAQQVYDLLLEHYGNNPLVPRREPMHELISTILSHRTTEANEARAYRQLRERFGDWEAVRDAPVAELATAIAPSNFAEAKVPKIKAVLAQISAERGAAEIGFLADLPVEEGMGWLMRLPGVGPKTAALVLLFCFAKPILPVDTHVHRVSQRLGFFGPKVNPTQAHPILWKLLPHDAQWLYNYHINQLRHGQQICVWGRPRCERCPLTAICDYYQSSQAAP